MEEATLCGTGAQPQSMALTQFGQWLIKQCQLMRKVLGQQEWSQAALLQEMTKAWKPMEGTPAGPGAPLGHSPLFLLTKLEKMDNMEMYLEALEHMTEASQ